MKRFLIVVLYFIISIQLIYSQIPKYIEMGDLKLADFEIGEPDIGKNTISFSVTNKSDSLRNIYFSIRVDGSFVGWQKGQYFSVKK